MSAPPTIGRTVIYRSKTGRYAVPAIITATVETLLQDAVDGGHIPALSDPMRVHLCVLTPGTPGERLPDTDVGLGRANPPGGGIYQEWDVPWSHLVDTAPARDGDASQQPPGTWAWPKIDRAGGAVAPSAMSINITNPAPSAFPGAVVGDPATVVHGRALG